MAPGGARVEKNITQMVNEFDFCSGGPGFGSPARFVDFLARTRAEWLGRRTQLLSGMFKARRSPLTKTSISHSRDPQVVSHQGTTHALIWSRWGANSEVGNLILYLVMGRGSQ